MNDINKKTSNNKSNNKSNNISNTTHSIRDALFEMQDLSYKEFQSKLIPGIAPESVIGIRIPELRKYAKELFKSGDYKDFLEDIPHKYYDENNLHMFLICMIKEYDECMRQLERFLPCIDNWATCDIGVPKVIAKDKEKILNKACDWINSSHTYTVRYGVGIFMRLFLEDDFDIKYPEMVARIKSEEYYINMMRAWYFATALAKQYESILPFIEQNRLDKWTHNKTIQKAVESFRIKKEQKEYLKTLKRK